jgi:hypothetical protein
VGTGIKLAPTYACLGLGKFENLAFNTRQELLERILTWKRFIDDVFMLFRGSRDQCEELVNWLNSLMPGTVKFKFEFSEQKVEFLDLEILIENGKLKTNLFVKPSNKQLYLDFTSNHPQPCKASIPYSQALRIVERCSSPQECAGHLSNLKEKLTERNYPSELIDKQFDKAKAKDRKSLIFKERKKRNQSDKKVRLIFTHNQSNPPFHMWVRECKKLLAKNEKAKDVGSRIQLASKQPKNLQRLVGGYKGGSRGGGAPIPEEVGCKKCNKCHACPKIEETRTFRSTNTKKTYKIKQAVNCVSNWVIYLVTCQKCYGQYVGKSKTPFKVRHSNHKQEIRKGVGILATTMWVVVAVHMKTSKSHSLNRWRKKLWNMWRKEKSSGSTKYYLTHLKFFLISS